MDEKLLRKYLRYASTDEAFAVLFVKQHLDRAKGHWIDIVSCARERNTDNRRHFRRVTGGLYRRSIQPSYPPRSDFITDGRFDELRYIRMVRAITWETAQRDIEQQKNRRVAPVRFEITGGSHDRNQGRTGFFRDDAPPEIKALEANLRDRTHPLWDIALRYAREPEFVYEVRKIKVFGKPHAVAQETGRQR